MNFKAYDILASLIPGFLLLIALMLGLFIEFDQELMVFYTAIAFLLGYLLNTLSSWLEDFYFWTWGGKPSSKLIRGKDIWKVRFYHSAETRSLLLEDCNRPNPSDDELFSVGMRCANGEKDCRVEDFNAQYAFSRALLTTMLISSIILIIQHPTDLRYLVVLLPLTVICWLRCKQRAYYYSKEVLTVYLKIKKNS